MARVSRLSVSYDYGLNKNGLLFCEGCLNIRGFVTLCSFVNKIRKNKNIYSFQLNSH